MRWSPRGLVQDIQSSPHGIGGGWSQKRSQSSVHLPILMRWLGMLHLDLAFWYERSWPVSMRHALPVLSRMMVLVVGWVPQLRKALILNEILNFDMVGAATTGWGVPHLRYPDLVSWSRSPLNEFIWTEFLIFIRQTWSIFLKLLSSRVHFKMKGRTIQAGRLILICIHVAIHLLPCLVARVIRIRGWRWRIRKQDFL